MSQSDIINKKDALYQTYLKVLSENDIYGYRELLEKCSKINQNVLLKEEDISVIIHTIIEKGYINILNLIYFKKEINTYICSQRTDLIKVINELLQDISEENILREKFDKIKNLLIYGKNNVNSTIQQQKIMQNYNRRL